MEEVILNKLLVIKVEIKNIKITITDNVATDKTKIIYLYIDKIITYGCDNQWQEISSLDDTNLVHRALNVSDFQVILQDDSKNDFEESMYNYLIIFFS